MLRYRVYILLAVLSITAIQGRTAERENSPYLTVLQKVTELKIYAQKIKKTTRSGRAEGSISLKATGGSGQITFKCYTPDGKKLFNDSIVQLSGLKAGRYYFVAMDSKGNIATYDITIENKE